MSLIWVHEDAMQMGHPVMDAPDAKPVFIWDSAIHATRQYSLKRRVFIYEAALDMGIPIYAGDTTDILLALSDGQSIRAAETPDPIYQTILHELAQSREIEIVPNHPFIQTDKDLDLRRFFRFWNAVKTQVQGTPPKT